MFVSLGASLGASCHTSMRAHHLDLVAGVNQWDVDTPPKYISSTHLAARVGSLNPRWNEDSSSEKTDAQFLKAVKLTGSEFEEAVDYISKVRTFICTA